MPAYNEEKYIGEIVLLTKQYVDEVIIGDDGSRDDTSKIAKLAGATVLRCEINEGYGVTIQKLLLEAKRRNPDVLILLDADAQHNPHEIPNLVKPIICGESDVVVGSRRLCWSSIPLYRRAGLRVLTHLTCLLSGRKLFDTECGFRAFSGKAIAMLELRENGMAISAETIYEATKKNLRVVEVPVSVVYTKDGSTLNPIRHGLGNLIRILTMISRKKVYLSKEEKK